MKMIALVYFLYGAICCTLSLVYVAGIGFRPSAGILIGSSVALVVAGVRRYYKDDGSGELKREGLTLIAALSPGLLNITMMYKDSKRKSDLLCGALLLSLFILSLGYLIVLAAFRDPISNWPDSLKFLLLIMSVMTILGTYDVSVTLVNGYCDSLGLPYGRGRFEIHHEHVKKRCNIIGMSLCGTECRCYRRLFDDPVIY